MGLFLLSRYFYSKETMPRTKKDDIKKVTQSEEPQASTLEVVIIIGGVVLLMLLLYTMQTLITPFLTIASIIFLLYPLRTYVVAKNIMWLAVMLFVFWFFNTVQGVLAPFIVSMLLSYILHPVVSKIEDWGVPRWTSTLFIILCFIAGIIVLLMVLLPATFIQFDGVLSAVNTMSNQFTQWVLQGNFIPTLNKYGISTNQLQSFLTHTIAPRIEDVMKELFQGAFNLISGLNALITGIVNIVIIPFLTFYILKDFPLVKHRIKMLVPRAKREQSVLYFTRIDDVLGRYIRGTIIISLFDAIAVTILFWSIGVQYPMVLGIVSGVLFFIPYFGFIIMLCLSAVVSSLSPEPTLLHVITVSIGLATLHVIENYVLSPRIIGKKIGLHPVVLILSIFLFGYFLGFIGLLIAIPAAGSIIVIAKEWELNRKKELRLEENL